MLKDAESIKIRNNDGFIDEDNPLPMLLAYKQTPTTDYESVDIQNPLPVDGDSVYSKDIWVAQSDMSDFSGEVTNLFNDVDTDSINSTSNNPKTIIIRFNRIVFASVVGLGAKDGTFSNVKMIAKDAAGTARVTVDESTDSTQYTSMKYPFSDSDGFIELEIQFHTTNQINLNVISIPKIVRTISRLQAIKPDGTETEINATSGGNLKVSLEEIESGISSNSNSQLNVTQYLNDGTEGGCLIDYQTKKRADIESLGSLKTITPIRLIGTTFSNGTKDTNFWAETITGSGTVTQSGEILLSTGTTADSTAKYETVRVARKVTGTTNQFRAVARNVEAPAADCIRRIGPYDSNEGFFVQFNGETFQFASRKSGVDTLVSNGSFNGNGGATIDFGGGTDFTRVVIEYTALSAKLFLDGTLIHTIIPTTASLTTSLNLPVTMEVINENGNTTDNSYEVLFATIVRLGELITSPASDYQAGTTTGKVLKYNAGIVNELAISSVANNSVITLYDNTAASGTILYSTGAMPANTTPFVIQFEKGLPFNNGLTLVISGANSTLTTLYE